MLSGAHICICKISAKQYELAQYQCRCTYNIGYLVYKMPLCTCTLEYVLEFTFAYVPPIFKLCPWLSSLPRSRFLDVTQRSPKALRDIQKNGCEGDYWLSGQLNDLIFF